MNKTTWPIFNWNDLNEGDFNDFCINIIDLIIHGSTIHFIRKGGDKGLDGRIDSDAVIEFAAHRSNLPGPSVIQNKWRDLRKDQSAVIENLTRSMVKKELNKKWRIENPSYFKGYFLLSNCSFTVPQREKIEKAFNDEGIKIIIFDQAMLNSVANAHPVLWHFLIDEPQLVPLAKYRIGRDKSPLIDYDRPYVNVDNHLSELKSWLDDYNNSNVALLSSAAGGMGKTHLLYSIFGDRNKPDETVLWLDCDKIDWTSFKRTIRSVTVSRFILVIDDGIENINKSDLLRQILVIDEENEKITIKLILATREVDAIRWINECEVKGLGKPFNIKFTPVDRGKRDIRIFDEILNYEVNKLGIAQPKIRGGLKNIALRHAQSIPMMLGIYAKAMVENNIEVITKSKGLIDIIERELKVLEELKENPVNKVQFLSWLVLAGPVLISSWDVWSKTFLNVEKSGTATDCIDLRDDLLKCGVLRKSYAFYKIQPQPLIDNIIEKELIDYNREFKPFVKEGLFNFFFHFSRAVAKNIYLADQRISKDKWLSPMLVRSIQEILIDDFSKGNDIPASNIIYFGIKPTSELLYHIPDEVIELFSQIINNAKSDEIDIIEEISLSIDSHIEIIRYTDSSRVLISKIYELVEKMIILSASDSFQYMNSNPVNLLQKMNMPTASTWWNRNYIWKKQWTHSDLLLNNMEEILQRNLNDNKITHFIIQAFEGFISSEWINEWFDGDTFTMERGNIIYSTANAKVRNNAFLILKENFIDKRGDFISPMCFQKLVEILVDKWMKSLEDIFSNSKGFLKKIEQQNKPFTIQELKQWYRNEANLVFKLIEKLFYISTFEQKISLQRDLKLKLRFNQIPEGFKNNVKKLTKWEPHNLGERIYGVLFNSQLGFELESTYEERERKIIDIRSKLVEELLMLSPENAIEELATTIASYANSGTIYGIITVLFQEIGKKMDIVTAHSWWKSWESLNDQKKLSLKYYLGMLINGVGYVNKSDWREFVSQRIEDLNRSNIKPNGIVLSSVFGRLPLEEEDSDLLASFLNKVRLIEPVISKNKLPSIEMVHLKDLRFGDHPNILSIVRKLKKFIKWSPVPIGDIIYGLISELVNKEKTDNIYGYNKLDVLKIWQNTQYYIPQFNVIDSGMYPLGNWLANTCSRGLSDSLIKRIEIWIERYGKGGLEKVNREERYEIFSKHDYIFKIDNQFKRDNPWTENELIERFRKIVRYNNSKREDGFCSSFFTSDLVDFFIQISRIEPEQIIRILFSEEFSFSSLHHSYDTLAIQFDKIINNDMNNNKYSVMRLVEDLLDIDNSEKSQNILINVLIHQVGVYTPHSDGSTPKINTVNKYLQSALLTEKTANIIRHKSFWTELQKLINKEKEYEYNWEMKRKEQFKEGL